jgi:Holliday junction resolvasome RuvABC endonuclease subunit
MLDVRTVDRLVRSRALRERYGVAPVPGQLVKRARTDRGTRATKHAGALRVLHTGPVLGEGAGTSDAMILAIDPGLATFGWALVSFGGKLHALGFVATKPDPGRGVQTDRIHRARALADAMLDVHARYPVAAIVGEALSFPPAGRVAAVASLCIAWGAIVALAAAWCVPHHDVLPRVWQSAILGRKSDDDYPEIEQKLMTFVLEQPGLGREQLAAIPAGQRNHVLDAVGIGLYAARIGSLA